jgi:hypothetical protein
MVSGAAERYCRHVRRATPSRARQPGAACAARPPDDGLLRHFDHFYPSGRLAILVMLQCSMSVRTDTMITIYADVFSQKLERLETQVASLRDQALPADRSDWLARLETEAARLRAVLDRIDTDGLAA